MLERVKDFRYEEIKNWKPIVSLRESYRRENALRNWTLIPVCILAVFFAFALLNGWIQFNDNPETANANADNAPLLKPAGTNAGLPNTALPNTSRPQNSTTPPATQPNTARDNRRADVSLISATPNSTTNVQTSGYSNASGMRIAVCDTELLAKDLLQQWKQKWEYDYTQTLTEDRENMWNLAADLTTTEVNIIKKIFEQKKRFSEYQIKLDIRESLEKIENEIKPACIAVCQQYDFDLIIPKRHALAFSTSVDVTDLVGAEIEKQARQRDNTAGNWNLTSPIR